MQIYKSTSVLACMQVHQPPAGPDGWRAHDAAVLGHLLDRILLNLQTLTCAIHSILHISTISRVLAYITSTLQQLLDKFTRPKYFVHTPADKLELGIVLLIWLKIILCRRLRQRSLKFATRIRCPNSYGKVAQCCCISFYSFLLKDSKAHDPIFTS